MGFDNIGSLVLSEGCCSSEPRATFFMLEFVSYMYVEMFKVLTCDLFQVCIHSQGASDRNIVLTHSPSLQIWQVDRCCLPPST
jgi:hypothetical protein